MVARVKKQTEASRRPPARSPEARENEMISLAYDLAEERLRDGTASAQETVMFLKMGSSREKLEQYKLEKENELMQAKMDQLASEKRIEALYADALEAMSNYSGKDPALESRAYDD